MSACKKKKKSALNTLCGVRSASELLLFGQELPLWKHHGVFSLSPASLK